MWLVYSNPWQLFLLFYAGRPLPPPIDGAKVNAKCRSIIHAGSHVGLACRLQEHRFPKAAVAFGELDRILNMSIKTLMPVSRTIGKNPNIHRKHTSITVSYSVEWGLWYMFGVKIPTSLVSLLMFLPLYLMKNYWLHIILT